MAEGIEQDQNEQTESSSDSKGSAARWVVTLATLITSTLAVWGAFTSWHRMEHEFQTEQAKIEIDRRETEENRRAVAELNENQARLAVELKEKEIAEKRQEFQNEEERQSTAAVAELLKHLVSDADAGPYISQTAFYSGEEKYRSSLIDAVASRVLASKSDSEVRLAFRTFRRIGQPALKPAISTNRVAVQWLTTSIPGAFASKYFQQNTGPLGTDDRSLVNAFYHELFSYLDTVSDKESIQAFVACLLLDGISSRANAIRQEQIAMKSPLVRPDISGGPSVTFLSNSLAARAARADENLHSFAAGLRLFLESSHKLQGANDDAIKAKLAILSESVSFVEDEMASKGPTDLPTDLRLVYLGGLDWTKISLARLASIDVSEAYLSDCQDPDRVPQLHQRLLRLRGITKAFFVEDDPESMSQSHEIESLITYPPVLHITQGIFNAHLSSPNYQH